MTCNINHQHCQFKVNAVSDCQNLAKIRVTRPNPVDLTGYPKFVCFSHLMTLIKHSTGQFLVEKIEVK